MLARFSELPAGVQLVCALAVPLGLLGLVMAVLPFFSSSDELVEDLDENFSDWNE